MRFLSPNFTREGKGVKKDNVVKYDFCSFFQLLVDKFWLLIKLNFLFILFCIPIVTIPASIGALYSITTLLVQRKHVFILSDFISVIRTLTLLALMHKIFFVNNLRSTLK